MKNDVEKLMKNLNLSREEALEVIKSDKEIDKMTMTQLNAQLTDEQKKAIKSVTKTGEKKPTVYKFDTTNKSKKENPTKRELVAVIQNALAEFGVEQLEVTNIEREMVFNFNGSKFKVVLSAPRT